MRAALAFVIAAFVVAPAAPAADKYPTKPIRLVAPFPPGGGTDILGRLIAVPVGERLGQTVVVDNRPGAGGALGAGIVAHAAPDGYTLVIVSSSYSAASAFGKPKYDPVDGIQPVILIGTTGIVLSVHPSVPATSVSEFISHVKANPGKLNYASVGTGSVAHLLVELFKLETKTNFVHVAYKGGGPALAATIGGEVQVTAISAVPSMPHIRAGRLRPLGVTTLKRLSILPDVPSIGDTVPGFEVVHWYAMWAPKGTPRAIVNLWNEEVARVVRSPQMVRQMGNEGLDAAGGPPQEFYDVNKTAVQKWRRVIKEAKLGTGN
ncbi:MAG: tripartite tricarboxylate transporter substrate-binding protein [Burkholderiales bacterium]